MRRTLTLAAVLVTLAVTPSHAAPTAEQTAGASLSVPLETTHGRYLLQLLGTLPDGPGRPELRVRLVDPSGAAVRLSGTPDLLRSANGGVELRARLGRLPLRVTWGADGTTAASFGTHEGDDDSLEGWSVAGSDRTARLWIGDLSCVAGHAIVGRALVYDTDGYGEPLTRGIGTGLRGARCGADAETVLP